MAESILSLSDAIDEYDELIEATLKTHKDRTIFASLPGAAKLTQSRLIAAMGTRRDRFAKYIERLEATGSPIIDYIAA